MKNEISDQMHVVPYYKFKDFVQVTKLMSRPFFNSFGWFGHALSPGTPFNAQGKSLYYQKNSNVWKYYKMARLVWLYPVAIILVTNTLFYLRS